MANKQLDMSNLNEREEELPEEKMQSTAANSHNPNDHVKRNNHRSATHSKNSEISAWKLAFNHKKSVDLRFMVWGTLEIVADGLATVAVMLILTSLRNTIRSDPSGNFIHNINKHTLLLVYFPIVVWFAAFLEAFFWARSAERQASRMRRKYLKEILRQGEGFLGTQGTSI